MNFDRIFAWPLTSLEVFMNLALPSQYQFLPRFFRLATIAVLSNMMVPLAGLVDTAFLGHLEDIDYLAGVILGSILFDYLYRVLKFLRTSTTALTAQAVGEEDQAEIWVAGLRSALVALLLGLGILALQYPLQKFGFALLTGAPGVEQSGMDYFYGRIWGAPAVLLNFVILGWLLGQERNGLVLLISLVANFSNVGLDYLMINRWGWASAGAGWATASSQYLALAIGLISIVVLAQGEKEKGEFKAAIAKLSDWGALRATIALKGNILIRFVVLITTYSLFTNISSSFGTEVLAQNGLLLQIALLSQFTIQGVGMTNQTLTGNFKSKGEYQLLLPVLLTAIGTTLVMALGFAAVAIIFPETLFGILTNHAEINDSVRQYTIWLLPLLETTALAFMLEGYFIGLKASQPLRNAVLFSFLLIYLPCLGLAIWQQSNNLLWFSLVSYMLGLVAYLGWQLITRFSPEILALEAKQPS
ncbi:MATE family efflux transporter [Synechocystis sp. CS-94]|nr:DNA-damage-inducible protein [Synechocystis sp. PCC 6714]MCT0252407.1 MATE family efflux transporter [Synechocystis sp. CS-94]